MCVAYVAARVRVVVRVGARLVMRVVVRRGVRLVVRVGGRDIG